MFIFSFILFYVVKMHPVATLLGRHGWYRGTLHELHFLLALLISEAQFNLVSATRKWLNFNLVSSQNVIITIVI